MQPHWTDIRSLATVTPTEPAMTAALQTLSLVQLGSVQKDERLLHESRRLYGVTLKQLFAALSQVTEDNAQSKELIATITVLGYCEYFKALSQRSWSLHAAGLRDLFNKRGPLPLVTNFDVHLFHYARHTMFLEGIINRKRVFLEEPKWLAVSSEGPLTDFTTRLLDIAMKLPGLLEDTDHAVQDALQSDLQTGFNNLTFFVRELEVWLDSWHASMDRQPYTFRETSSFRGFFTKCDDRTFPESFDFPDYIVAYHHELNWLCQCFALSAMFDYVRLDSSITHPQQLGIMGKNLLQYVKNLCMIIPYFMEPGTGTTGCICTFMPLRFAKAFFEVKDMQQELGWCHNVLRTIYRGGVAPPYYAEEVELSSHGWR